MQAHIQLRRDFSAVWTAENPILLQGERGLELDSGRFKTGDGVTPWNSLAYFVDAFTLSVAYGAAQAAAVADSKAVSAAMAGGGSPNLDGGESDSNYGGGTVINAGGA